MLGTGSLTGGVATYSTPALSIGTHSITASYGGDTNDLTSSSSVSQAVGKDATTVSAPTTSNANSVLGEPVTFTATVALTGTGTGTPTGTVTFLDGATSLGTGSLNTSGVATFTTTSVLGLGAHSITASYGGDANFQTSVSSATTQTVGQAATTGTVVSSVASPVFGQSITLTATVVVTAPGTGIPTGTVTFLDGATVLGTASLNAGVATFAVSSLSVDTHSITASYGGDTTYMASTSPITSVVVGQASSTTTIASPTATFYGQSAAFTATVGAVAPGVGTPSGTVTFLDGGTQIGTGTLTGGVATYTTSARRASVRDSITASYGGDTDFTTSNASAVTQSVTQSATTVAAPTSSGQTVYGQSVTFTTTVTATAPGTGTPTGTVTFYDGRPRWARARSPAAWRRSPSARCRWRPTRSPPPTAVTRTSRGAFRWRRPRRSARP